MTISNVELIISRIKSATPESQIAVFKNSLTCNGYFNAVFADTILSKQKLDPDKGFIGCFDHSMNLRDIQNKLNSIAEREAA